jgi:surface protein
MAYRTSDNFMNLLNDMRDNLPSLKTLSIRRAEGEGLTSGYQLFKGFSNLETLNLGIDGSKIKNTAEMFMGCSKLRAIGISGFTQGVAPIRHASSMFEGCSSLTSLDIDNFNTRYLATANKMFKGCSSLQNLIFAENNQEYENFGFLAVANEMFSGCKSLYRLEIPNFNVRRIGASAISAGDGYISDMRDMFYDCTSLQTVVLDDFKIDNSVADDSADDVTTTEILGDKRFELFFKNLNDGAPNIKTISLKNFDNFYLTSMKGMFLNFANVENIYLDNCNTQRITDMSGMFQGCRKLKSLDLSSFNTSKVTTMESMFNYTGALTNLNISGFDFTNVKTFNKFFYFSGITTLDMSNFDTTGNVTDMSSMFTGCGKLTNLSNLDKLDTHSCTTMIMMFYNCSSLENLNVSNFITSNVTNMSSMFSGCSRLKNIDVSSFNTNKVISFDNMFARCSSLVELDLSSFRTPKTSSYSKPGYSSMFTGCSNLNKLDISGLTGYTSKARDLQQMFDGCTWLEYLDISNFREAGDMLYNAIKVFKNFGHESVSGVLNIGMLYMDTETCVLYAEKIWEDVINVSDRTVSVINIYVQDANPSECRGLFYDDTHPSKKDLRFITYEREEKTTELPTTIPSGRKLQWDEERREYYIVNQYGTMTPTGVKEKIKMETYDITMFVDFHDLQGDGKIQIAMKEKIEEESDK